MNRYTLKGASLVRHRIDDDNGATCFPTDTAAYRALCEIGAPPGEFSLRQYRNEGWFIKAAKDGQWVRLEKDMEKTDIKSEMRTIYAVGIARVLLDNLGPSDTLLVLAEAMRNRGIEEFEKNHDARDVAFWRIARKAAQIAAGEIDKASEAIGSDKEN